MTTSYNLLFSLIHTLGRCARPAASALGAACVALPAVVLVAGCEDEGAVSATKAKEHAQYLKGVAETDVEYIRKGLPQGAKVLAAEYKGDKPVAGDPQAARDALEVARNKVQDLRVAKSTFFALVLPDGKVVRNDQEQDLMAGKNLLAAFPDLKAALDGKYVEGRGSMKEAAGVKGRGDGQWIAAHPVDVGDSTKALYVTGWSWSSYAYALEFSLRSKIKSDTPEGGKVPLVYVYMVVGDKVYGAPVSPEANATEIAKQKPLSKATPQEPFVVELELGTRSFGLAVVRVPKLGKEVGIAVLRSEV